jgi:hypothetical protein
MLKLIYITSTTIIDKMCFKKEHECVVSKWKKRMRTKLIGMNSIKAGRAAAMAIFYG